MAIPPKNCMTGNIPNTAMSACPNTTIQRAFKEARYTWRNHFHDECQETTTCGQATWRNDREATAVLGKCSMRWLHAQPNTPVVQQGRWDVREARLPPPLLSSQPCPGSTCGRCVRPKRTNLPVDLEAFSHNPSDGSLAPLAYQPST